MNTQIKQHVHELVDQIYREVYDLGCVQGYDNGYEVGLNDAWNCAREIVRGRYDDLFTTYKEPFHAIRALSASRALAIIKEYEETKGPVNNCATCTHKDESKEDCSDCNNYAMCEADHADGLKRGEDTEQSNCAAYKKGLEDAWEYARKVGNLSVKDRDEAFHTAFCWDVINNFSVDQVMSALTKHEIDQKICNTCANKDPDLCGRCRDNNMYCRKTCEIEVGDEIICKGTNSRKVVLKVTDGGVLGKKYVCFGDQGISIEKDDGYRPTKTGRHFEEIVQVIDQLKS